jgi:UDP-N-acetylglucosamine--dolichyl-phosphate N-acetylglucosaminephosphotransferase
MYRLDKYGTLSPSYAECNNNSISTIGKMCLKLFSIFKIIHIEKKSDGNIKCNNLTLINLCLLKIGPTNEKTLTIILLIIQVSFDIIMLYTFVIIFFFSVCLQFICIYYTLPIGIIIL